MTYRIRLTFILLLVFVLVVLVAPFLVAVPELESTVSPQQLALPESLFMDIDGQAVHYLQSPAMGEGAETFILLHGFGSNLQMWTQLVEDLTVYGEVIRFDAIGSGLSDKPVRGAWKQTGTGFNPYTNQGQLAVLESFLEQRDIQNPILVGHASGANLAIAYALKHQNNLQHNLRGLILISAAVYAQGGAPDWFYPLMLTSQVNRVGVLPMRQFAGEAGNALYEGMWAQPDNITEDARARHTITTQTDNWDRAMWEVTRFSRPLAIDAGELEQINVPSLVLAGDSDILIPQEQSETLAQALKAEFIALERCGHLSPEECPHAISSTLADWLAQLDE